MIAALLASLCAAADLSFEEAVAAAAGAPAGRAIDARADEARANARGAAAWQNPTANVESEPDTTLWTVTVPIGLAPLARGAAVGPAVDAAAARADLARAELAAEAGAAWLDARRAADLAEVAGRSEALAVQLATAAEARVETGEWSTVAAVLARADAARSLERALGWQQEARVARQRLSALVGAPVDALGPWPEVPAPPSVTADATPAARAAALEARAARAERLAAQLGLVPSATASAGWASGDHSGPLWGASVAIPLFSPGISTTRAAGARADAAQADAERAALDGQAALLAIEAEIAVAERLSEAWRVPGLDGILEAAWRLYDAGEISLPDYLARRDLALDAVSAGIDARWRLARARLAGWALAGQIPGASP